MNFAVGMITAPRPRSTISRAVDSITRAGFDKIEIFSDHERRGSWPNWYAALCALLPGNPRADTIVIVEDDAVFCLGLRAYLEKTLWPADDCAICSAYSPGPYNEPDDTPPGWSPQNRGLYLVGSLCWAMPREAAAAIIDNLKHATHAKKSIDCRVGLWAADSGRSVWYHKPSLVQHIGGGNSALDRDDPAGDPLRLACDFIGEDNAP